MSETPDIPEAEYARRLAAVRGAMARHDVDLALISTPENIFYLTGLDHWGYFAPHILVVPHQGDMVLVTRAMEKVTVENQVRNAGFEGHEDSETAADLAVRLLNDPAFARSRSVAAADAVADAVRAEPGGRYRIGIEAWSAGLPYGVGQRLKDALPASTWTDISGIVDRLRQIKSPAEQACMRAAARVSDAAMTAAVEAIHAGASEREVAAACQYAMIAAGGTFPGFGPFIRPATRLGEEHTSWGDGIYSPGDVVFLELSGCIRRYHAPTGRLVFVDEVPDGARAMERVCLDAFDAVVAALRPGAKAREVYAAWQGVVDDAGLAHYRRHHCGYLVGIGFPPSWTGGNTVTGLRHDSDIELAAGMTFHILSWLMGTGRGDYFASDTVLLGDEGAEVLTRSPRGLKAG